MGHGSRIVRSVCWFSSIPDPAIATRLLETARLLWESGYQVQTLRVCCPGSTPEELIKAFPQEEILLSIGSVAPDPEVLGQLARWLAASPRLFANCDLTDAQISVSHASYLIELGSYHPAATFRFAFTFQNARSSPFFPSASYERDGFSVGLQSTDLAAGCSSLQEWLQRMREEWDRLVGLLDSADFLGIDSSVAPLGAGDGSLAALVYRLGPGFERAVTSDFFMQISSFLARANPRPVGLCGLMFPCLEDFGLAEEYEKGRFALERNLFLALHSGLGIDTYPFGMDESPHRMVEVLRLVQGLANKYRKPLSVRLVTDGRARCGEPTAFSNPYLKDVTVRPL